MWSSWWYAWGRHTPACNNRNIRDARYWENTALVSHSLGIIYLYLSLQREMELFFSISCSIFYLSFFFPFCLHMFLMFILFWYCYYHHHFYWYCCYYCYQYFIFSSSKECSCFNMEGLFEIVHLNHILYINMSPACKRVCLYNFPRVWVALEERPFL